MKNVVLILASLISTSAFAYTSTHETIPVLRAAFEQDGNSMMDLVDPRGESVARVPKKITIGISLKDSRVQAVDSSGEVVFDAIVNSMAPVYELIAAFGGIKNARIVVQ